MRAEKTCCPQAYEQYLKPTFISAHLSPVSESLFIPLPLTFLSAFRSFNLTNPYSPPSAAIHSNSHSHQYDSLLPYHLSHLNSAFAKVPLGKVHPPVLLWHCTVTTDPVASSPLLSALLSISPTHTAGAFPAAALLPSAPAGKRNVVCE